MSCRCADGYGPNLLGKCVPVGGPLQSPVINLDNGTYHTAGTRVRLSFPPGQASCRKSAWIEFQLSD